MAAIMPPSTPSPTEPMAPLPSDDESSPSRRALVVDDDQSFRSLVCRAIEGFGFEVMGVADAEAARTGLLEFDPDILIVDLSLGEGPSGLDLIQYIRAHHDWVAILVLTAHRSPILVEPAAPRLPADVGYLVKADVIDVEVLREAIDRTLASQPPIRRSADSIPVITKNQADVLRMVAEGLSNNAIAEKRECSVRALERVIHRLYRALGLPDDAEHNQRVQAARMYWESLVQVK